MTLANTIRENKAVYTVAGMGDLAYEKIREVQLDKYREQVAETVGKYRGEVLETVDKYRGEVLQTVERYRGEVRQNVGRIEVKDLPGAAVSYATHFGTRAVELIDELAERGRKVVHREAVEVAEITEKPAPKARAAQQKKTAQADGGTTRKTQS
jgi:hypothetical protein